MHETNHNNFYKSLILKISMYKDIRGEDLREGFYRDSESPFGIAIYYFAGISEREQPPILESARGKTPLSKIITSRLFHIDNFDEYFSDVAELLEGCDSNLQEEIDLNLTWLSKKRPQPENIL